MNDKQFKILKDNERKLNSQYIEVHREPCIADTVQYMTEDGELRAAIVTSTWVESMGETNPTPGRALNLTVFGSDGSITPVLAAYAYNEMESKPGCWNWPPHA